MGNFISVISPIRNEDEHIAQCLTSLVNQDYDHDQYEILVVDGMSTNKTRDIVKDFQQKYNNIKLFDNPNKTAPYGLNIGLQHARGDIIIRVDGHAFVEKDYLSQCVKYLESTKAECVGGVLESVNETFIGKAIALAMSSSFGVGNARFRTSGEEGYVDTLAFGAYRREIFDKIGTFDEKLTRCQDDEFNYRLRKHGGKIFLTPKIKSYYFPRGTLFALWQQYYQYGLWKICVLKRHLKMMQFRQFVPPAFVSSLLLTGGLGLFSKFFGAVFLIIALLYITIGIINSFQICLKKSFKYSFILPMIFLNSSRSYWLLTSIRFK